MASFIQNTFGINSPAALTIITISLMLFCGFAMTRITKLLRLPNVTAYIITGIVLGPYCLDAVPSNILEGTEFLSDVALAFIAFSTGEFFKLNILKKNGYKVAVITLFEALMSALLVFAVLFGILKVEFGFALVLSALAAATASASTMMTIRQTGAKGDFVNTLLQVVALDNVISLIAYSVTVSVAVAMLGAGGEADAKSVFMPLLINIGVFALGGVFGFFLVALMKKRSTDNRLIVSVAVLFAFCGVCAVLDVSPLLGCMSMATVYINVSGDEKLFKQLNYFSPPLLLLFFVRSGVSFDLGALFDFSSSVGAVSLLVIGVAYFIVRIIGKYSGAFLGCLVASKDKKVRNNLGLALIPQAGVSIGLATLGARAIGGEIGSALMTVILASGVLYELVGPAVAKLSLHLSGSYSEALEDIVLIETLTEDGKEKTAVEQLTERIQKIQEQLPEKGDSPSEDEQAFLEAAEEQYAAMLAARKKHFTRNR